MSKSSIKYSIAATVIVALLVGAAVLTSAPAPIYTQHDKAYYADEATLNFVRPGLDTKITGVDIAADGTVKAKVKFADPKGVPLDRDGIYTPGPISMSMMIARIPSGATQYVAYTTRVQTSPITGVTANQAGADAGGVWAKVADGEYTYTFGTKLPANYDKTATHTVGAYGSRNLTEFDFGTNYDDAVYTWVPDGSAVKNVRDVIKTATCNKCHYDMGFHGGSRKTMEICVLCHTPQTTDPDTGNTVDMAVMVHKIHQGSGLPSVVAGKPYVIIGNRQSVNDYSHISFPADVRRCTVCHEQNSGAAQAKNLYAANRAACGSCHDNVNFATGENHMSMPQPNDNRCTSCHPAKMETDFDASIDGAHVIANYSPSLPGVVAKIVEVQNTKPGQSPLVVFNITDKKGNPILSKQMTRLTLYLAGANSDYTSYISENAINADGNGFGTGWYQFTAKIPADAKGSWTIAMEARRDIKLMEGTQKEVLARDIAPNQQYYFSVDGTQVQPRRKVVDLAKCNACHGALGLHGGNRNNIEQCVLCHNPTMTATVTSPAGAPRRSIELGVMVHKIHRGAELERGYGVASANYSEIGYPGDLRSCVSCHVPGTEQLPLTANQIAVADPFNLINPTAPRATAACTACHDSQSTAAHAAINTHATLGESCATCHGANGEQSVSRAHAQ